MTVKMYAEKIIAKVQPVGAGSNTLCKKAVEIGRLDNKLRQLIH